MADGDDKTVIAGAGGGKGGGGRKPVEAPDTLHSIASAQVLDLVSEGPIVGFATENPLESIYLDETPLANPDGSLNFKDVQVEYRYGTQDQDYIKGFPSVENEILANVELRADTPFVRSITNTELSAVRVRLSVQGLSKVDEETNDLLGHHVAYAIDLATDGGAYKNVLSTAFSGKTTSEYARSHRIDLPPSTSGWTLRVRRITPNSESATVNDTTIVQATTEIIDAKLRYPNSAIVGTKVNAEQFPTIPRRAFDLVGRIVRVPSNYDPIARTYDGIWDGTFKPEWTDSPAWIYYDAVLHDRYGLGHRIESHQVDQWALYRIARICDEMVPDGKGGLEPRYTCNIFIQEQVEAYRLLRDLASVFNGIAYYADNRVIAGIDAPSDAVVAYSNADVIDGRFTYSGSGKSTRATVALVTWYDPDDFHRPKIEPVVDDAGVARYGIEQIDLIATGCTSQGQAQRAGWWALLTGRLETEGVSFSLGLNGTFAMPGQIIKIADQHRAGRRIGGRVSAATQNVVTIDHIPDVAPKAGDKLSAMLSSGFVEQREVLSVDGNELTTTPFTSPPVAGGAWLIETSELVATTWRVVSVTEEASSGEGNSGLTFNVSAVEHAPEKFAAIDGGALIEGPPTTQLPSTVQPAPTSVTLSAVERAGHVVASPMLAIEWPQTAGAVRYGVAYRRDDGEWVEMPTTTGTRVEVSNVFKGTYLAQVWAYNSAGVTSSRTTSDPFVFGDQTMVPGVIADHEDRIEQSTQQLADQQAAIDQEIADRIAEDLRVAGEAAADATDKAQAVADALNDRADQLRDDIDAEIGRATDAETALNLRADQLRADIDSTMAQLNDILGAEEWDAATAYQVDDLVEYEGALYRALQATTGDQPDTSPAYWEKIGDYASLGDAVAAALSQLSAHADEIQAQAESLGLLGAKNGAGTAWMLNMQTVRVSASETLAQWRSSIQSQFGDTNARIDAEETARANADSAQVGRISTMEARMPAGTGNLATAASVTAEATARANADTALATRAGALEARMPSGSGQLATAASVTNEASARAAADSAMASDIALIGASNAGNTAFILNANTVRVNGTESLAQWRNSIQASFDNANARIDAEETARVDGDAALASTLATVQATANNAATKAELTTAQNTLAAADQALGERIDVTDAALRGVATVVNPGFEDGAVGWWGSAGGTTPLPQGVSIPTNAANAYSGERYLLLTANDGSGRSVFNQARFAAKPLETIRLRMQTRTAGPTNAGAQIRLGVREWRADGGWTNRYAPYRISDGGTWLYPDGVVEGNVTLSSDAAFAQPLIYSQDLTSGAILCDSVEVSRATLQDEATAQLIAITRAEVEDHGDTLAAHTAQIATHTAEIAGKASTTYVQSVEGTATAAASAASAAQGTADSAAAQASANLTALTGLSATVGDQTASINELREVSASAVSGNAVINPSFETDDGWLLTDSNVYMESANAVTGNRTLRIAVGSGHAINLGRAKVKTGQRLRLGGMMNPRGSVPNSGALLELRVRRFNADGAYMTHTRIATFDRPGNYNWHPFEATWTVPAGTSEVAFQLSTTNHTSGAFAIDDVYLEPENNFDSRMAARHTVALNVNGHVSGTVSENDGERSSFSILATVFRVISGANAGLEWQNGYLRAYAFGAQVILGVNFGASNDLMMWAGPNVGANNCTKANGTFWLDNTGDGYFAGRVMQGVLRWFQATQSTSGTASTTTGNNPRLGKSVSLTVKYRYGALYTYRGTGAIVTPGSGNTRVTIHIERRYGSGAWTELYSETITGSAEAFNEPNTIATWSVRMQGEFYATDTASSTNSEYRARISSRSLQSHDGSGQITDPVEVSQYLSIEAME